MHCQSANSTAKTSHPYMSKCLAAEPIVHKPFNTYTILLYRMYANINLTYTKCVLVENSLEDIKLTVKTSGKMFNTS